MTGKWPSFVTKDLGDTQADDAEMMRRWQEYDRQIKKVILAGGVHQDADGWWVENATGELVGPDPEMERPLPTEELASANLRGRLSAQSLELAHFNDSHNIGIKG
ncbi:hypothetical protein GHK50_08875 [Sinorhizobium medicae]|uniref:Uncharacterized protein n=1 Tax=Sinorhizobium medicae TaxID=110321 RepID=A0A6G1WFZ3_9HYPH|nr:hypothetical protein [Sinorhizobium medicae]MQV98764.1 hypothetical protein [Sinorhizobium medicae]MQW68606.1 hypothetical protein [Sinorhizobium medicae]MQX48373.1 hypothetical protein [Sinorhizobium medicae]MQX83211.1 hypothetical protein [Sinorhizobium medicae]RVJ83276.1 hypothetical protein CN168_07435 [Sinorhizobium medicae]